MAEHPSEGSRRRSLSFAARTQTRGGRTRRRVHLCRRDDGAVVPNDPERARAGVGRRQSRRADRAGQGDSRRGRHAAYLRAEPARPRAGAGLHAGAGSIVPARDAPAAGGRPSGRSVRRRPGRKRLRLSAVRSRKIRTRQRRDLSARDARASGRVRRRNQRLYRRASGQSGARVSAARHQAGALHGRRSRSRRADDCDAARLQRDRGVVVYQPRAEDGAERDRRADAGVSVAAARAAAARDDRGVRRREAVGDLHVASRSRPASRALGHMGMPASNNWVVDGTKTMSGKPMLASDPHLPQSMPSIWYEAVLVTPDGFTAGALAAGSPGSRDRHQRACRVGRDERVRGRDGSQPRASLGRRQKLRVPGKMAAAGAARRDDSRQRRERRDADDPLDAARPDSQRRACARGQSAERRQGAGKLRAVDAICGTDSRTVGSVGIRLGHRAHGKGAGRGVSHLHDDAAQSRLGRRFGKYRMAYRRRDTESHRLRRQVPDRGIHREISNGTE